MSSNKVCTVHRIPNSHIVIDYWNPDPDPNKSKFIRFMTFLRMGSHHLDQVRECSYTLYTSEFNKWVLVEFLKIPEDRVIAIEENETIEIFDKQANENIRVTLFDANYCAGSCMLLFEGSFGNILFTGYFRPPAEWDIFEVPALKSLIKNKALDVVYIDNTYAADYCEIPKRGEVVKDIISLIRGHPNHKILIAGKPLGKEEVLVDIAETLNVKICIPEEKYELLARIGRGKYFTTDSKNGCITAVDHVFSLNECRERQSREGPCLVILLTAQYEFQKEAPTMKEIPKIPGLKLIPYSGHCCHSELVEFLSILKPRQVKPIIDEKTSPNCVIPESIYKLCYDPALSHPMLDSDWDYETCPDIIDSEVPEDQIQDSISQLAESSQSCNDRTNSVRNTTLSTDISDRICTSMELCQSGQKDKPYGKLSPVNDSASTDDVFADASNGGAGNVSQNESVNENAHQNLPFEDRETGKSSQVTNEASDSENFEDTVEVVQDSSNSQLNRAIIEKSNAYDSTPGRSSPEYHRNGSKGSSEGVENPFANTSTSGEEIISEQHQNNRLIENPVASRPVHIEGTSILQNCKETDILRSDSEGVNIMKDLLPNFTDSSDIIEASDPIYRSKQIVDSTVSNKIDAKNTCPADVRKLQEAGYISPKTFRDNNSQKVPIRFHHSTANDEQSENIGDLQFASESNSCSSEDQEDCPVDESETSVDVIHTQCEMEWSSITEDEIMFHTHLYHCSLIWNSAYKTVSSNH